MHCFSLPNMDENTNPKRGRLLDNFSPLCSHFRDAFPLVRPLQPLNPCVVEALPQSCDLSPLFSRGPTVPSDCCRNTAGTAVSPSLFSSVINFPIDPTGNVPACHPKSGVMKLRPILRPPPPPPFSHGRQKLAPFSMIGFFFPTMRHGRPTDTCLRSPIRNFPVL